MNRIYPSHLPSPWLTPRAIPTRSQSNASLPDLPPSPTRAATPQILDGLARATLSRSSSAPVSRGTSLAVARHPVYFNHEETMGVEVRVRNGAAYLNFIGDIGDTSADARRTTRWLHERISVKVGDRSFVGTDLPLSLPLESLANNPTWSVEVAVHDTPVVSGAATVSRTMGKAVYDAYSETLWAPETGEEQPRLGVGLLRQLSQFILSNPEAVLRDALLKTPAAAALSSNVDLHTHFGGALRAETLLDFAEQRRIPYPKRLLKSMGIPVEGLEEAGPDKVLLSRHTLSQESVRTFLQVMRIRPFKVTTFKELESIYMYRGPIVKHYPAFGDFLRSLAEDYKKAGVTYVELSISDILDLGVLRTAHAVVDDIANETGVRLRFKAALWRHSDPVYNRGLIDMVMAIKSPLLVGVDFMGEETNSTRVFEDLIRLIATYKRTNGRPNFAIQVHAGESTAHPANVKLALASGATQIGHGLQGINEEVLDLALKTGAIIQINLNSNLALSNIQSMDAVTKLLREYIAKGVRVTFGSDGPDMYGTSAPSERDAALMAGLTAEELRKSKASDANYMAVADATYEEERATFPELPTQLPKGDYGAPHWLREETRRARRIKDLQTEAGVKSSHLPVAEALAYEPHKKPFMLLLPGETEWLALSPNEQNTLATMVHEIVSQLDPANSLLFTGGTIFGADALIHATVAGISDPHQRPTLVGITPDAVARGTLDAGLDVLSIFRGDGHGWGPRNDKVMEAVMQRQGYVLALGGGKKALEAMQTAFNKDYPNLIFFKDAPGELRDIAKKFVGKHAANSQEILRTLATHPGLLRGTAATVALSSHQETIATAQPKPLPPFVADPRVQNYVVNHYHYAGFDEARLQAARERQPSAAQQDLLTFIDEELNTCAPYPEGFRTPVSQEVIFEHWREHEDVIKLVFDNPNAQLSVDPQFLTQLFSRMTDADQLRYVRRHMGTSRNVSQTAAKLAIWLNEFAKIQVPDAPASFPATVVPYQTGDKLADFQRDAETFVNFTALSQVKKVDGHMELLSVGKDKKAWSLAHRKATWFGEHGINVDAIKQTAEQAAMEAHFDREFLNTLLYPDSLQIPATSSERTLVVLRGMAGRDDFARTLKSKLDAGFGADSAPIVGTNANINAISLQDFDNRSWPATRSEFVERNKLTATALMQLQRKFVLFSDPNKHPAFARYYMHQADALGYQVMFVKVGDLSYENHRHYIPKLQEDFTKEQSQWRPGQQKGETSHVDIDGKLYPQLIEADAGNALLAGTTV